jgi:hypothetical protein
MVFGLLCFIGLLQMQRLTRTQVSFIAGLGICAAAAFIANLISTDFWAGFNAMRDFLEPMLWLFVLFGVKPRAYPFLLRSLTITMTVFFIVSLYPVMAYAGILPNLYPPIEFIDPTHLRYYQNLEHFMELGSVIGGGFAGQSTTWGMVVPTAALLTAALYLRGQIGVKVSHIIAGIVVIGSIASIGVTSARGGTMTLAAVGAYGLARARGVRFSNIILLLGAIFLVFSIGVLDMLPENFFRGFDSEGNLFTRMNEATTGRLGSFVIALERFVTSPVIGTGQRGALIETYYGSVAIHNTWLKILAESGLIVFLPALFIAMRLLSLALCKIETTPIAAALPPSKWPDTRLVTLSGLILSLAEPGTIFGTFNASATFWTGVWLALVRPSLLQQSPKVFREAGQRMNDLATKRLPARATLNSLN